MNKDFDSANPLNSSEKINLLDISKRPLFCILLQTERALVRVRVLPSVLINTDGSTLIASWTLSVILKK